jgi:nicotinic acid phosphoribosyltransferase
MDRLNLTMLTDFYEITMANGYLRDGLQDRIAYFDMFFRKVPDNGGFAIMAGVEQLIEYLKNLKFDEKDIDYLRSKKAFSEDFLHGSTAQPVEGRLEFPKCLDVPPLVLRGNGQDRRPVKSVFGPIQNCQLMGLVRRAHLSTRVSQQAQLRRGYIRSGLPHIDQHAADVAVHAGPHGVRQ